MTASAIETAASASSEITAQRSRRMAASPIPPWRCPVGRKAPGYDSGAAQLGGLVARLGN
jgi:hypothetical protein